MCPHNWVFVWSDWFRWNWFFHFRFFFSCLSVLAVLQKRRCDSSDADGGRRVVGGHAARANGLVPVQLRSAVRSAGDVPGGGGAFPLPRLRLLGLVSVLRLELGRFARTSAAARQQGPHPQQLRGSRAGVFERNVAVQEWARASSRQPGQVSKLRFAVTYGSVYGYEHGQSPSYILSSKILNLTFFFTDLFQAFFLQFWDGIVSMPVPCSDTPQKPSVVRLPPDHVLLDSVPNHHGTLISRWKINKFENQWYKSVMILEVLKLLFQ